MRCIDPRYITLKQPIWSEWDKTFIFKVPTGCGNCAACIDRKVKEWTFRLQNERVNSACCYFVTLTYDNMNVPINNYGKMELRKKDVQDFIKKLRYMQKAYPEYGLLEDHLFKTSLKDKKISYYCAGEYGSKKFRPHYHLIMFNTPKKAIIDAWQFGEVDIQIPRETKALSYVIKYLHKRLDRISPPYRKEEFSIMSKGIGKNYIKKMAAWHRKNLDVLYTADETMDKVPLSKYYRNHIFNDSDKIKQIPIIKRNLELIDDQERKRFGDKYNNRKDGEKRMFIKRYSRNNRKRKDT